MKVGQQETTSQALSSSSLSQKDKANFEFHEICKKKNLSRFF
jgi:hypothetical protein